MQTVVAVNSSGDNNSSNYNENDVLPIVLAVLALKDTFHQTVLPGLLEVPRLLYLASPLISKGLLSTCSGLRVPVSELTIH